MPLLATQTYYLSSKFMNFKNVLPNNESFDKEINFERFCLGRKHINLRFTVYTLEFLDMEVMMFYHHILPIIDYEYQESICRWVTSNKETFVHLLQLDPERGYSLVDSWDVRVDICTFKHMWRK